jgi:TRAP-type C4-dicarboxylate transport system, periplasmic component
VQPYLTLDYHVYDFLGVFVNPASIEKMPKDLQDIFQKNITEFVKIEREKSKAYDERDIQAMKDKGISVYTLTDEEYKQMVDATMPVRDKVRKMVGDEVMDKVLAQVDALKQ